MDIPDPQTTKVDLLPIDVMLQKHQQHHSRLSVLHVILTLLLTI